MRTRHLTSLHLVLWSIGVLLCIIAAAALQQTDLAEDDSAGYYFRIFIGLIILPAIFSFYACYLYLFPKFLQYKKVPQTIVAGILILAVSAGISFLSLLVLADLGYSCHVEGNFVSVYIVLAISLLSGIIAIVLKGFFTWYKEIKLKEELMVKNHAMEIALVKSQLDPHFLFNTINNIDILIEQAPQKASAYLNKLSDIMRFMLYEAKPDRIPLEKEVSYIKKYIELQKIRTDRNFIHFEKMGDFSNRQIAPMIFIPIIENAFKHVDKKAAEDAICIAVSTNTDSIVLNCRNTYDPGKENDEIGGLGVDLIQKRLELLYPDRHDMSIQMKDNVFAVELVINDEKI